MKSASEYGLSSETCACHEKIEDAVQRLNKIVTGTFLTTAAVAAIIFKGIGMTLPLAVVFLAILGLLSLGHPLVGVDRARAHYRRRLARRMR